MGKRGLSHIEVILGFVIFMIAIFFLLASYRPLFKEKYNEEQIVYRLYEEFLKNTSLEVKKYYAVIEDSAPATFTIDIGEKVDGYGIVGTNSSGGIIQIGNVDTLGSKFCINWSDHEKIITLSLIKNSSFTYITFATCPQAEESYNITANNMEKKVYIDKIKKFNESYYENIAKLKGTLEINQNYEFDYNISLKGREYIGSRGTGSEKANVYSITRKIKIINETGIEEEANVMFKIW